MDRRSQASLTFRIVTEVLGLSLLLSAFVLAFLPQPTPTLLLNGLIVFAILFAILGTVWARLGNMVSAGIFWSRANNILGMVLTFGLILIPAFFRLSLDSDAELQSWSGLALTIDMSGIMALLAVMIRQGNVYQTKRQWRLAHHALWVLGGALLLTLFIPMTLTTVAEVPVRYLSWLVVFLIPPLVRRIGSSLVATPAGPPAPRVNPASATESDSSTPADRQQSQQSQSSIDNRGRRRRNQHGRPRRYGGSRRRM